MTEFEAMTSSKRLRPTLSGLPYNGGSPNLLNFGSQIDRIRRLVNQPFQGKTMVEAYLTMSCKLAFLDLNSDFPELKSFL